MTTKRSSNESQSSPPPNQKNTCLEKQPPPLPRQSPCPEIQSHTVGKGQIFPDLPEPSSPPLPVGSVGATQSGSLASATKALQQRKKGAFFLRRSLWASCSALLCFLLAAPATATPAANRATTSTHSKTSAPRSTTPSATSSPSTKPSATSSPSAPAVLQNLPPQPKVPPPSPPQRKISSDWDHPYLLAAYALVWLALLLYVFFLSRRQRQTEKLLDRLEAQQSALEDLLHEKSCD